MEKQMDLTESSGGRPREKKRRGYGLLLRLIALVLVVALFVGMTSVDFSLVRYQGTDQMAAAQYLMDQTTYLQENRFERLKSLLTQLDSYSINLQAAERAIGRSDYDRAASFLEKAIPLCQDDQEQAELYIRLGCVYMLAEQPEPALTAFDSGIQGKPEEAMPYLLRGQLRYQQGNLTGAAEDAGQYVSLGGAEAELLSVAASLCELGGDLEGALEALNRILGDSTPEASQAKTLAERGRVKYLLGQVEEAVADIRQAKSLDENGLDGVHYAIVGMDAFQNEDYETSQQDFLKAARLSQQNNAEYYEQAILCAYMVGDYQAVRDMGEEAQGKNFMTSTAWLLDGIALFSLEDYEAAEMALTRSMDTGITPTGVYYYRGLTRLALGEYALAAQDFGEAIQLGESVLECTFNRGICYYALGENEKAVLDFQTVEQDSPDPALAASAAEMLEAIEQVSAQTTGE